MSFEAHSDEKKTPKPMEMVSARMKLQEKRILVLEGEVNAESIAPVRDAMLNLTIEDPESDIILFINSPGGSVYDGMTLIDLMNTIPNDVVTIATGMAASMGQLTLSSGAEGKRFVLPSAQVMAHQPSSGVGGKIASWRHQASSIAKLREELAELIARRTNKSFEEINAMLENDSWYSAGEAVEYGLADKVLSPEEFGKVIKTGETPAPAN